ncbi:MAG: MGH1-like glycoside hydrolase domain-containing protein [Oceanipulchritudo sp.]
MKHSNFDLNLPDWGPYGKQYVGLSHLADFGAGDRWDCYVMPGYHRRRVFGPYALRENFWHYWKAKSDLSAYTLRYELEWKDRVYVDVHYEGTGDGRMVRVEYVNQTELPQNLDLHLVASYTRNPMRPGRVRLPEGGHWIGAMEYAAIHSQSGGHRMQHAKDALKPGCWPQPGAVDGLTLGSQFFNTPGDRVAYQVAIPEAIADAVLLLRYHRWTQGPCRMRFAGFGLDRELAMEANGKPMEQMAIAVGKLDAGTHAFAVESMVACAILVEGFAILPKEQVGAFSVNPAPAETLPEVEQKAGRVELAYEGLVARYFLEAPEGWPCKVRRVTGDDVPAIVCEHANDSVHPHWRGNGAQESMLLSIGPVALDPGERKTLCFRAGKVGGRIKASEPFAGYFTEDRPYAFGMERLAATTLANVVFPVQHRDRYVRHNTPGRWWDCLYTWDSGMLGIGLAAIDLERAKDCLDQYLLPEDDPYAAYVDHGTPLPIQAELAREIWERSHNVSWLADIYPKLRNFYSWLAGRSRGSTTDRFQTGLLQIWDYNYNSGGWDDYPPQWALHKDPARRAHIAPCVTTSFAIRFARHMSVFAKALGKQDDEPVYADDRARWAQALEHAWDPEVGYYSYVEHGPDGGKIDFYRTGNGENFNRGMDGISPLLTGELSAERRDVLVQKLFDPTELWTEWGCTTVSRSASYYSDAGYWNGAVWMPHNVMLWKALREQGLYAEARRLAEALLSNWEREARATYHCFELFRANTGRGSGWHQFSGLSAPLLLVYEAEFNA